MDELTKYLFGSMGAVMLLLQTWSFKTTYKIDKDVALIKQYLRLRDKKDPWNDKDKI